MRRQLRPIKVLCWMCVGLMASTVLCDVSLAQGLDEATPPDTSGVEAANPEMQAESPTANERMFSYPVQGDSLNQDAPERTSPVYRKWWVWVIATAIIVVAAVLAAGGDEEKAEENLPDFPEPPER